MQIKNLFQMRRKPESRERRFLNVCETQKGLLPSANIYSFAPFSESFQTLPKNVRENKGISCFQLALSDKEAETTFFVNKTTATCSLLQVEKKNTNWAAGKLLASMVEAIFVPIYQNQYHFDHLVHFLREQRYSLFDIFDCRYSSKGQLKWAKVIFTSPTITNLY